MLFSRKYSFEKSLVVTPASPSLGKLLNLHNYVTKYMLTVEGCKLSSYNSNSTEIRGFICLIMSSYFLLLA